MRSPLRRGKHAGTPSPGCGVRCRMSQWGEPSPSGCCPASPTAGERRQSKLITERQRGRRKCGWPTAAVFKGVMVAAGACLALLTSRARALQGLCSAMHPFSQNQNILWLPHRVHAADVNIAAASGLCKQCCFRPCVSFVQVPLHSLQLAICQVARVCTPVTAHMLSRVNLPEHAA